MQEANFLGVATLYKVRTRAGERLLVRTPAGIGHPALAPGSEVHVAIDPAALVVVD